MNIEHRDIDKFIPFGEALRGFVNQKFITPPVLQSILKERGIFVLNADKDYMVPIMQTLLLSPAEFDKDVMLLLEKKIMRRRYRVKFPFLRIRHCISLI